MTTLELIKAMEQEKKDRKIFPTHVLARELISLTNKTRSVLKTDLVDLINSHTIKMGHTVNDVYFEVLIHDSR